jgi:hypothetical protein
VPPRVHGRSGEKRGEGVRRGGTRDDTAAGRRASEVVLAVRVRMRRRTRPGGRADAALPARYECFLLAFVMVVHLRRPS